MFVLREDFLAALDQMVIEEPTEHPRRKPRRQDLPNVPKALSDFMDGKPGTLKRRGPKATTPNGRNRRG